MSQQFQKFSAIDPVFRPSGLAMPHNVYDHIVIVEIFADRLLSLWERWPLNIRRRKPMYSDSLLEKRTDEILADRREKLWQQPDE
jgi:hypothetical protein